MVFERPRSRAEKEAATMVSGIKAVVVVEDLMQTIIKSMIVVEGLDGCFCSSVALIATYFIDGHGSCHFFLPSLSSSF